MFFASLHSGHEKCTCACWDTRIISWMILIEVHSLAVLVTLDWGGLQWRKAGFIPLQLSFQVLCLLDQQWLTCHSVTWYQSTFLLVGVNKHGQKHETSVGASNITIAITLKNLIYTGSIGSLDHHCDISRLTFESHTSVSTKLHFLQFHFTEWEWVRHYWEKHDFGQRFTFQKKWQCPKTHRLVSEQVLKLFGPARTWTWNFWRD